MAFHEIQIIFEIFGLWLLETHSISGIANDLICYLNS